MEFSNHVGQELYQLLARRSAEELADQPDLERHTSMLGAALIPVAEVLRHQIEEGADPERLLNLTSRWLRVFLDPVSGKRESEN
jgi:hypothetical protein